MALTDDSCCNDWDILDNI